MVRTPSLVEPGRSVSWPASRRVASALLGCAIAAAGLVVTSAPAHAVTSLYNFPGEYTFAVPAGVTSLSVVVKGGNGGTGYSSGSAPGWSNGGQGAKLSGSIDVTPGANVHLLVASSGSDGDSGSVGGGGGGYSAISAGYRASPLVIAGGGGGGAFSADGSTSRPGGNGGVSGSAGGGRGGYVSAAAGNGGLNFGGGIGGGNGGGTGGGSGDAGANGIADGGGGGGGFGGAGGRAEDGSGSGGTGGGGSGGSDYFGGSGGGGGGGYGGGGGGDGVMAGGVFGAGGGGSSYLPDVVTEATNSTEDPFISITYTPIKQDQTITFPAVPDVSVSSGRVLLGADASSFLSVTYTSATPEVCTINVDEAVLVAAGTCTVYADQAGSETYNAAPQVSRSFTVLAAVPDPVSDPVPDPAADRAQTAPSCATPPRKIARRGTTKLVGPNCRTDAGAAIGVRMSVTRKAKKHLRLVRGSGGAVAVRTDGSRIRLTVTWAAGAVTGFLPYSLSRAFRT